MPNRVSPLKDRRPTLVVVAGRPGSGKTTLARLLARALSCPLISRDDINQGILRTLTRDSEAPPKDVAAKLAFDAFFRVIETLLSSKATLVAEAAFQDERWRIGLEPIIAMADAKVVHCTLDGDVADQRALRRKQEQGAPTDRTASEPRPFEPLSLPMPSLRVATADGYEPGLEEIVSFIASGS